MNYELIPILPLGLFPRGTKRKASLETMSYEP
jgi:hypothetical protein